MSPERKPIRYRKQTHSSNVISVFIHLRPGEEISSSTLRFCFTDTYIPSNYLSYWALITCIQPKNNFQKVARLYLKASRDDVYHFLLPCSLFWSLITISVKQREKSNSMCFISNLKLPCFSFQLLVLPTFFFGRLKNTVVFHIFFAERCLYRLNFLFYKLNRNLALECIFSALQNLLVPLLCAYTFFAFSSWSTDSRNIPNILLLICNS